MELLFFYIFILFSVHSFGNADELDEIFMSGSRPKSQLNLSNERSENVNVNARMLSERQGHGRRRTMNIKSSDPIIFPNSTDGTNSTEEENHEDELPKMIKSIPLKFLREIAQESDVHKIFEKYVGNVKLENIKGHTFLVNSQGNPIDVGVPIVASRPPSPATNFGLPRPATFAGTFAFSPKVTPQLIEDSPNSSNSTTMRFGSLPQPPEQVAERIGASVEKITKHAGCEPELKTVQIPPPIDPSMIQIPSCIRIEQCGGCCLSNLLSCEPVEHKMVEVQIQKLLYKSDAKLEYIGTQKIVMQAHSKCRCGCRVKSSDCSSRHIHDEDQCQCVCRNWRDAIACQTHDLKIWNSDICQCECREEKDCNSGFMFDPSSCNCIQIPTTKTPTTSNSKRRRRERHTKHHSENSIKFNE